MMPATWRLIFSVLAWGILFLPALAAESVVGNVDEFEEAVRKARPGDVVTLKDGTWKDADLAFVANGMPDRPITLRSQTPGKVIITGASRLRIGGSHLVVDGLLFHKAFNDDHLIEFRRDSKRLANDCRLTNCALVDCNDPNETDESRWVSVYGERNRVDHCWIEGKTGKGTTLVVWVAGKPNDNRIDHNYFGPRPVLGKNGGETIRIGDSKTSLNSSRTIIENNLFEECDGEAELISNKSCDNVYRGNCFLRCSGALTLRHGNRCLVDGNYFLGERARGSGGVRIIGEDHRVINNYFADLEGDDLRAALTIMNGLEDSPADGYAPVKTATVAFNTFVHCKETFVIGRPADDGENVPPANCLIANNLIVARRPAIDVRTQPVRFRWMANLLAQSGSAGPSIDGIHLVDDPLLKRAADGMWRPRPNDRVVGTAAEVLPSVTEDIDGQKRDAKKDVGCDQISNEKASRKRPSHEDVGPLWQVPTLERLGSTTK